ncbi:O-antigen ligase family protein [Clostridium botulinum]|nr:O-antigen ligase family protein [Clostridium botulinum]NFL58272.1 O-antigen ligase family protein [Clostridium botulinum]NFL62954.1 O-antigen ligase family protein [Clostridium botulinum]NFO67959.1 O-antigen ligase family protein [Clostridium botulinum]
MNKFQSIRVKKYNTNNVNTSKIILKRILLYIVIIPYLYPRGFSECFQGYKKFFTAWMYLSVCMGFIYILLCFFKNKIKFQKILVFILIYYAICILITIYNLNGLGSGLQKMFAAPILCLFYVIWIQQDSYSILTVTSNIMIIEFLLDLIVFNPSKMMQITGIFHLNFLGHVQVYSEYGLIALYIAYILFVRFKKNKVKPILLSVLSVLCMINSETDASKICLIIIIIILFLSMFKGIKKLFLLDSKIYVIVLTMISVIIVFLKIQYVFLNTDLGVDLTFSGRTFIWNNALELISSNTILGYGIQGAHITTFWGGNMNYAHNQFLQNLLDGGIVLCISFYAMILTYVSEIKKIKKDNVIFFSNVILICYMFLMIFESVSEYFYIIIFLSIVVCIGKIFNYDEKCKILNS